MHHSEAVSKSGVTYHSPPRQAILAVVSVSKGTIPDFNPQTDSLHGRSRLWHVQKSSYHLATFSRLDKQLTTDSMSRCAGSLSDNQYSFSPLECPLPKAPNLKMLCIYGVGHDTERAYHYEHFKTQKVMSAFLRMWGRGAHERFSKTY